MQVFCAQGLSYAILFSYVSYHNSRCMCMAQCWPSRFTIHAGSGSQGQATNIHAWLISLGLKECSIFLFRIRLGFDPLPNSIFFLPIRLFLKTIIIVIYFYELFLLYHCSNGQGLGCRLSIICLQIFPVLKNLCSRCWLIFYCSFDQCWHSSLGEGWNCSFHANFSKLWKIA